MESPVTAFIFRPSMLAVVGLLIVTSTGHAVSQVRNDPASAAPAQGCQIDDGYGRYVSCDSGFKEQQIVNRPKNGDCVIDDGYGRTTPCDSNYKEGNTGDTKK